MSRNNVIARGLARFTLLFSMSALLCVLGGCSGQASVAEEPKDAAGLSTLADQELKDATRIQPPDAAQVTAFQKALEHSREAYRQSAKEGAEPAVVEGHLQKYRDAIQTTFDQSKLWFKVVVKIQDLTAYNQGVKLRNLAIRESIRSDLVEAEVVAPTDPARARQKLEEARKRLGSAEQDPLWAEYLTTKRLIDALPETAPADPAPVAPATPAPEAPAPVVAAAPAAPAEPAVQPHEIVSSTTTGSGAGRELTADDVNVR